MDRKLEEYYDIDRQDFKYLLDVAKRLDGADAIDYLLLMRRKLGCRCCHSTIREKKIYSYIIDRQIKKALVRVREIERTNRRQLDFYTVNGF